jgi:uncharacterized protein DUF5666
MRPRSRPWLLRWLLCSGLIACAHPALANPCADSGDGMGGTGLRSELPGGKDGDTDGIGGTGIAGSTGVVGVITGFGSICVNGVEIHYGPDTPVTVDGLPGSASGLRLGHVVAVDASGRGKELKANSIAVVHELSGVITSVDPGRSSVRVLGQPVVLDPSLSQLPAVAGLRAGNSIRVSGLRSRDGAVVASLVEPLGPSGEATVRGTVQRLEGSTAVVAGVPVHLPAGAGVKAGGAVLVAGAWNGTELEAQRIVRDPVAALMDRVARVELQGRAQKSGKDLSVDGVRVRMSDSGRVKGGDAVRDDESVIVSGRMENGTVNAAEIRIERRPERKDRAEPRARTDRAERPEKPERTDRAERPERPERTERPERNERSERER